VKPGRILRLIVYLILERLYPILETLYLVEG
jgi:hypothetical protein